MSKNLSNILKGGTLPVIHGGTGVTVSTGTGSVVLNTSPSLVTPDIGIATATSINKVIFTQPSAVATLTLANNKTLTVNNTLSFTGVDNSAVEFSDGGTVTYTKNKLSVFSSTTSDELAGIISDETGSGYLVFGTSPTITTSLTTNSTSFDLINTTATTVNFAGDASTISIGASGNGTTTINHNLQVAGDIYFNGTASQLSTSTIEVTDTLLMLARDNPGDLVDVGLYASYIETSTGVKTYTGLVRDASESDRSWKLFSGTITAPSTTVDFGNSVYDNLKIAALTATTGNFSGQITSTVAQGIAPFIVTSTTPVANLSIGGNAATVTTNANMTGPITGTGNITSITSQTGTGTKFVMDTSPTLITPTIGVATATSVNKVTITEPLSSATLTIANQKVLTITNSLELSGTDDSVLTFRSGGQIAYTDKDKLSAFQSTSSLELAGIISDETGSGKLVFSDNPTLITPEIGAATGTSVTLSSDSKINNLTIGLGAGNIASNTVFGLTALNVNTSGSQNTAIGQQSLYSNTIGSFNTSIGAQTLQNNIDGSDNVAIGRNTLYYNTSGAQNVAIGALAGAYNGTDGNTTGVNNTFIGYGTIGSDPDNSNEIVIGALAIGLGSNSTVIGTSSTTAATIYGSLSIPDTTASSSVTTGALKVAGGVGIGGNLYVDGNLIVNGLLTTINSTTISVDDKNIELGSTASPTDVTADGGGITLKGLTDKTFTWNAASNSWVSNVGITASSIQNTPIGTSTANSAHFTAVTVENGGSLILKETSLYGINYISIKSPDSLAADYTITLPSTSGVAGQVLTTDGAGGLSFVDSDSFGGNIVYVSAAKGNDANDGLSLPVKTIKRALQIASGMVYNSLGAVNSTRVVVSVAAGNYVENNPVIIPDNVSVEGAGLRACVIRPLNANKDMFRLRNGGYFAQFTFRDGVTQSGVASYTWAYAFAFDDVFDTQCDRTGYINLPSTRPTMTLSPYIQNCSIISFLGGNGAYCDGSKVANPNVPTSLLEVEVNPAGAAPVQCKSMIANAFTMISFGGTGWRVTNDAYVQLVSCFQLFLLNGVYAQSGGYTSITNSATNFGKYALRSSGFSPVAYSYDKGFVSAVGSSGNIQTITAIGFTRPDGPVEQYVIRIYDNNAFTYNVAICQRDIGYVVDAIGYDMMFGGNFRSIKAAMTYYSTQAANVVGAQKTATIAAFTFLRDYIANAVNGDPLAGASVIANMNTINDIVNNGLSVVPASVIPEPANIEPGFSNAARLLAGNKSFLQDEITAFMSSTYTALWSSLTAPQRVLCQRDVGYIVDAIQYDLIYGCNLETTVVGRLYYNRLTDVFVENAGEKTAALDVVSRLRTIVEFIVTNNTAGWTKSSGNASLQFISGTAATPAAITFAQARFQEIYNTINTGVETAVAILPDTTWVVDANLVTQFGILQTTKDAIKSFVTDYISTQYAATDLTSQYKIQSPNFLQVSFNAFTEIDLETNVFTTSTPHGLTNGDSVVYDSTGHSPIGGLFTGSLYYIYFLNTVQFKLAHDDSLTLPVDIVSLGTGTHTFTKNEYELYVDTVTSTHTTFQTIVLSAAYTFAPGDLLEGTTGALPNKASVYSYDGDKTIVVAINLVTIGISQERNLFAANSTITKINALVVSLTVSSVTLRNDLHAATFNVGSTLLGGSLDNVNTLVGRQIYFHRASIVNSSGHTWEYAGSGIDYNALPNNGGKTDIRFEQYQESAGRVYSSGTNELGDFKVGDFITAYNRTGNIVFKNTVTVSQLNVLKLALSDISVDAISNDVGLGENEVGGPSDSKLSTQLAIWSYANQRLGAFIDKAVSTNAVPGALVQLNATGQINVDLIPAQRTSASVITYGYRSRLTAYDDVPSVSFLSGDNSTEEFETVTLTLSAPITALDGVMVTQSTSGATGLLKGDHTDASTILVASTGHTFTTVFDTTNTLTINLDSTPSTTNTSVYCLTVSSAISATDNSVLRNSTTNQYLVLPNSETYVYTFVGISKIFRYNNIAYVITDGPHLLVSSNQVKVTPTTLTSYTATPYVTVLSSTRFRYTSTGMQTTPSATTTNTASVPATTGTCIVTVASSSVSGGSIQTGDYVFSNISSFPLGSVVTSVSGTTTLSIAIEFPSVSDTSSASSTAGLTFIRPITEAGTIRSVITAVNNSAQGEVASIRKGMLTAVNNLAITGGSSYVSGIYYSVSLSNVTGTGSGALANITVTGDSVSAVDLIYAGTGYAVGNTVSASLPGGSGFSIAVSAIETHAYINNISDLFIGSTISPDFVSDNASTLNTITVSNTISKTFNAASDVNYGTNRITIATHGYSNGDFVMYNPGSNQLISGLSTTLPYYVKRIDANIIELYSEYSLTNIISLGTSSTGTHTFTTSAINITNNRFYVAAHGLSTGNAIVVTGTNLPSIDSTQIGDRSHFFIGSVTANTFTIHNLRSDAMDSVNGVVIAPNNITSIGSSTLSIIHFQVQIIGYSNTSSKQLSNWGLLASSSIDASNIVSGVVATSRLASSGIASSTTYLRGDSTWSTAVSSIQSSNSALTITGSGVGAMYGELTFDVAKTTFPTDNGSYSTLGVASFNINQFTVGTGPTAGLVYITAGTVDAGTLDGNDSSYYLDPTNLSASIPLNKGGTGISVYTAGDMIYASTSTSLNQLPIGPANTILSSNGTVPYWAPSLSLATVIKTGAGEISTTNAGSASVFNTNALTLNVGGAASSIYLGANSTGITLNNVKTYTTNGVSSTTVSAVYGIVAPINTTARNNSGVSTIVTTIPHGLSNGELVTIVCSSNSSYNVRNTSVTVTNSTTFTYSNAGSLTTVVSSTGSVYTGSQSLLLATTAANGDTKLIFGSTAGIVIGQIVLGDSHIPTNTTVVGVDALNVYLSAALTDFVLSGVLILFVHTNASLGIAVGNQITIASSGITNLDGVWPVTSASAYSTSFSFAITTAINATSAPRVGNITKANSLVLKNKNITIGSSEASETPVAATLIGEKSVGTNVAGVDFNIIPGTGTGNAASGSFVVKTGNGNASGTSPQTATTKLTIDNNGTATFTNSVVINQNIEVHGVETTGITSAAAVPVKSFSKTVYRSAKMIFQVTCTSGANINTYQIGEVMIIHDDTTAYMAEYGDIKTGANFLATFTCDIDGMNNVRILAQALTGDTISVRVVSSLNII